MPRERLCELGARRPFHLDFSLGGPVLHERRGMVREVRHNVVASVDVVLTTRRARGAPTQAGVSGVLSLIDFPSAESGGG